MSRNLCKTSCARCGGEVKLVGPTAPITREQAGGYFDEYEGMIVADATCSICEARYLAWIDEGQRKWQSPYDRRPNAWDPFLDLSYRVAFNDEPADEDVPPWKTPAEWRASMATLIDSVRKTVAINREQSVEVLAAGVLACLDAWETLK